MPLLYAKDIEPIGSRLLVRKYIKPEKIGSLYLNPAWLTDNSRALWEVVKISKKAEDYFGMKVKKDSIVITLPNRGVHYPLWDKEEHYFLFAEEVVKWIPKTW